MVCLFNTGNHYRRTRSCSLKVFHALKITQWFHEIDCLCSLLLSTSGLLRMASGTHVLTVSGWGQHHAISTCPSTTPIPYTTQKHFPRGVLRTGNETFSVSLTIQMPCKGQKNSFPVSRNQRRWFPKWLLSSQSLHFELVDRNFHVSLFSCWDSKKWKWEVGRIHKQYPLDTQLPCFRLVWSLPPT